MLKMQLFEHVCRSANALQAQASSSSITSFRSNIPYEFIGYKSVLHYMTYNAKCNRVDLNRVVIKLYVIERDY